MAVTREQVAKLYVATFNRAPDAEGLDYWVNESFGGNPTIEQIAKSFFDQPETQALYPPGTTDKEFVTAIYKNLFDRNPDQEGLDYWLGDGGLGGGMDRSVMILAILNGAVGTDADIIDNKAEVGLYFADLGLNYDDFSLKGITEDYDTVIAAKAEVNQLFLQGPGLFLTKDADLLVDTDGVNVFKAPLEIGLDGLLGIQTLQGQDVLDGLDGTDMLYAELNFTGTTHNPTISNIEQYFLTANSQLIEGLPDFGLMEVLEASLNLGRATGYEQLWNLNSRNSLTLNDVGESAIIGLDNVRSSKADEVISYTVNYDVDADVTEQTVVAIKVGSPNSERVELDVTTFCETIRTLNLAVSGGVYLELEGDLDDAIEHLVITGSGPLDITDNDSTYPTEDEDGYHSNNTNRGFTNLVTFDSTGYVEDLFFDLEGTDLTQVLTGPGNDRIEIYAGAFSDDDEVEGGDLFVDLGEGMNILAIDGGWRIDSGEINGLDFTGGVENVQTLAFDDTVSLGDSYGFKMANGLYGGDATLNLDGFSDDLAVLLFEEDLDGNGYTFAIANSPVDTLTMIIEGEMDDVQLNTGNLNTLNVYVNGEAGELDIDSLNGDALEYLNLYQTANLLDDEGNVIEYGQVWLDIYGTDDVDSLKGLYIEAVGDVDADLEVGVDGDIDALETIFAQGNDVTLTLTGNGGVDALAGRQQSQQFNVNITQAFFDEPNDAFVGFAELSSGINPVTTYTVDPIDVLGPWETYDFDFWTAAQIIAGLNATDPDFTPADVGPADLSDIANGRLISTTWNDFDTHDWFTLDITATDYGSVVTDGVWATGEILDARVTAISPEAAVAGDGFAALETVEVIAADDADVELTDVYGQFDLQVTAADNAGVGLNNTNAVSVTITASHADLDVFGYSGGDWYEQVDGPDVWVGYTYGNPLLETIDITAATADVDLSGILSNLSMIDFSNVTESLDVDVTDAEFAAIYYEGGDWISYLLGATSDIYFEANAAREVFSFVEDNIGNVVIEGFTAGSDPIESDRLDLSAFGFTNPGQLVFTVQDVPDEMVEDELVITYDNLIITDLAGGPADFDGSITLLGVIGGDVNAADFASLNIIYA